MSQSGSSLEQVKLLGLTRISSCFPLNLSTSHLSSLAALEKPEVQAACLLTPQPLKPRRIR